MCAPAWPHPITAGLVITVAHCLHLHLHLQLQLAVMALTRRLSLTLLVVAPLITAQERPETSSGEERGPAQRTMADIRDMFGLGDGGWGWGWGPSTGQGEEEEEDPSWGRRRRSVESSGEDMETAEQVLFRPIFRHHQLVEEREQRRRLRQGQDQLRRQYQVLTQQRPLRPVPLQHRYTQGDKPIKTIGIGAVVFRPQGLSSYHPPTYHYRPQ